MDGGKAGNGADCSAGGDAGGASAYRTLILAAGPRTYLRLDDAAGATFAKDESGASPPAISRRDLRCSGALANDRDTATLFDGQTAALVHEPAALDFTGTQTFPVEAWVNPSTVDDTYRSIASKNAYDDAGREEYGLFVHRALSAEEISQHRHVGTCL